MYLQMLNPLSPSMPEHDPGYPQVGRTSVRPYGDSR